MKAAIVSLVKEQQDIRDFLLENDQLSFATGIEGMGPKIVILAAASECEVRVLDCIMGFYGEILSEEDPRSHFVRLKALDRQFHAMFDWNSPSINKFWSLFGPNFSRYAKERVRSDESLSSVVDAFLELGSLRNHLVHRGFLQYDLPKTLEETEELATKSLEFVDRLPELLANHSTD